MEGGTILRILALVTAVIGSAFGGAAFSLGPHFTEDDIGSFFTLITLTGFGFSFLWTSIALALHLCRVKYHPGVEIAIDFLAFAASFGFGLLQIVGVALAMYNYDARDCRLWNDSKCTDSLARVFAACLYIQLLMALGNGIVHFIIFVRACRATHLLRKRRYLIVDSDTEVTVTDVAPKAGA